MEELQDAIKIVAGSLKSDFHFDGIEYCVEVDNRKQSRAEISFRGEEGEARSFCNNVIDDCRNQNHYKDVEIGFSNESGAYKIRITPKTRTKEERKKALQLALTQLNKDMKSYKKRVIERRE
jgi:hypothetical protein